MPSVPSATITLWVRTGSRFEAGKVGGISHFLEHMVFKGSTKRPSAKQVSEEIDAMGAQNNAGTAKEWTNFYIKVQVSMIEKALDILSDIVLNPLLKAQDIEREEGVILEEIAMDNDQPSSKVWRNFEETIFQKTVLGRPIVGEPEVIKAISRDDFLRYRSTHYYPENMVASIAGGLSAGRAVNLVEKYLGNFKGSSKRVMKPKEKVDQAVPKVQVEYKESEQAHLVYGYRGWARGHESRYAQSILATILGGGMSSRLFTEVREKRGLAYSVGTGAQHYFETGYMATYAGINPKNISETIKVIKNEHQKLTKETEISQAELNKAKEYTKGHMALALENTRSVNSFFGLRELLLGKIMTPEQVFARIDKATTKEIAELANRLIKKGGLNLAVIGPYKDSQRFKRLLQ